jgi:hypothetical protein
MQLQNICGCFFNGETGVKNSKNSIFSLDLWWKVVYSGGKMFQGRVTMPV